METLYKIIGKHVYSTLAKRNKYICTCEYRTCSVLLIQLDPEFFSGSFNNDLAVMLVDIVSPSFRLLILITLHVYVLQC